jgi:6-phosphogluconolactonase
MPTLYTFNNTDDIAVGLADFVKRAYSNALERHGKFTIGLSGGSLPKTLGKALVPLPEGTLIIREVFFADERAVPLDSEDSNYKLCNEHFFSKVSIPAEKIHTIDESLISDPQELSDSYEQELVKVFANKSSVKTPVFDLLLLGMGPDGHTCSLFPGHALLNETTGWVAPITDSPKPPPVRITLLLPVVTHAHKIAYVVAGAEKKDILKTVLEDPDKGLPCSLVNVGGGEKVFWFVDHDAAQNTLHPKKEYKL